MTRLRLRTCRWRCCARIPRIFFSCEVDRASLEEPMNRWGFIALVGGLTTAWSIVACAVRPATLVIGFQHLGGHRGSFNLFRAGLRDNGSYHPFPFTVHWPTSPARKSSKTTGMA